MYSLVLKPHSGSYIISSL